MTKSIIKGVFVFLLTLTCVTNAQEINRILYGDPKFMKLSENKIIYSFKEGLENGTWIAYYDTALIDSAILTTVIDGKIIGPYKRWDKTYKYVAESGNLVDGMRDGLFYFRLLNDDGKIYLNIEKWDMDKFVEYIQQEW